MHPYELESEHVFVRGRVRACVRACVCVCERNSGFEDERVEVLHYARIILPPTIHLKTCHMLIAFIFALLSVGYRSFFALYVGFHSFLPFCQ